MSRIQVIPGPYTPAQKAWLVQQAETYIGYAIDQGWIEVLCENLESGEYTTLEEAFAELAEVISDHAEIQDPRGWPRP